MQSYIPLHVHSEYSLLDGALRVSDIIKFAKANNMPAVAITDHGVMYGAIEFYCKAKEAGIKPIIGCEFYINDGDIKEKDVNNNKLSHLILLAKNKIGYKNLTKLVSIAHLEGFYYKPRINFELLSKYSEGLVCSSACLGGELTQALLKGTYEDAVAIAKKYKDLFKEDYYIEIQDHGLEKQKRTNPDLIKIAKQLGIKIIITNDAHYLSREDEKMHDILLCLQTGRLMNETNRMKFPNSEFYMKTKAELESAFSWLDKEIFDTAMKNSYEIADKCNLIIDMGKSVLPHYEVPPTHSIESYLDFKVREGLEKRFKEITPEIDKRCRYELETIESMGFAAYFLITWDFINYAKEKGIPVGPGRGSAAGSLVAYALGITDLDPIEHNLLFERFLNPERISMPDVDIDFCPERREEVIQYVTEKYGSDKVCQIITFGTLAARNAIKGVARVLDYPFAESNKISKMIEMGKTIQESLNEVADFKKLYEENHLVKEIVDYAMQLEGLKNNIGVHAAGVIIARDPLSDLVPIQNSKEGAVITEFAMGDLEKLGLLKMDFLGLRNLTIIKNTIKMVKKRHKIKIDINKIPLDDAKTYELLCNGQTDGVFQLESSGMKALVKRLKPSTFEDIGALVALYRPGPLDSGMVDDFVDRKHGRQKVSYPHPSLKPILEDTYGTIVYQEQIMQIAQVLAGYTLGEADLLRRAMGKKKKEVMDEQRGVFVTRCVAKGTDEKVATELFDSMEKFAAYCFNRAHSAAYAFIAYQTAYLKAHYAVEYLSALLSSVSDNQDKIQAYIAEGQKMDIKVLAPDINKSFADFFPDENNIRFGLASIKNVGMSVIDEIIKAREEKSFEGFYDFCLKVDPKALNKRTLESLIKAGAFCELEKNRKQLVENLDSIVSAAQKEHERKISGQIGLFGMMDDASPVTFSINPNGEEFTDGEIQHFEKELLGFYITSHPLESIRDKLPFLTTHRTVDLVEIKDGTYVTVCGLISQVRLISTKNGKLLKVGVIEDLHGSVEFVAFQEVLNNYNSFIEPEQKVIISGKIQMRGDDEGATVNLVVDSVKPVENCNIIDIFFNEKPTFEMLMSMKDFLAQNNGSDPVIFNIQNNGKPAKILVNSKFWVNTTNDFINGFKNSFVDAEISMRSLDGKEEKSKETAVL